MSWQGWQSWTDNGNKWEEREWAIAARQEEDGWQAFVRKERHFGVIEVVLHGHAELVFQEETRDPEPMAGMVFSFEGKRYPSRILCVNMCRGVVKRHYIVGEWVCNDRNNSSQTKHARSNCEIIGRTGRITVGRREVNECQLHPKTRRRSHHQERRWKKSRMKGWKA